MTEPTTLQSLSRPGGQWQVLYDDVDIVGEVHRLESCASFLRGARDAIAAKRLFGVFLEREPLNPYDSNAVKVVGWWTERRFLSEARKFMHIGYLPAAMAASISRKHPAPMPLAAELVTFEVEDPDDEDSYVEGGPINIVINVLIPR